MPDKELSYKEMRSFICTGCGKSIELTKFASQKNCQCDECKTNKVPINPEIVAKALQVNPPKTKVDKEAVIEGTTKIRPCIKCGKSTEVSKFMSDQKVLCEDCKGTVNTKDSRTPSSVKIDLTKLDRSRLLPIEEYEVNDTVIANKRLREVKCPGCGHEYMKPLSIVDWSTFGLVVQYQCTCCLLSMSISEQTNHLIRHYNPSRRFDYTGTEIRYIGTSSKEQTVLSNALRILIKLLDDNNINIDSEIRSIVPPYKWKNEKPVEIGYVIPDDDLLISKISGAVKDLNDGNSDHALAILKEILEVKNGRL